MAQFRTMGTISGTSQHPNDVPFVSEFWWGTYGLGAISPGKKNKFWRSLPWCPWTFFWVMTQKAMLRPRRTIGLLCVRTETFELNDLWHEYFIQVKLEGQGHMSKFRATSAEQLLRMPTVTEKQTWIWHGKSNSKPKIF